MVVATAGAFYLLALACPVGMGLMMIFMGKGMGMGGKQKKESGLGEYGASLADLKAEQARLAEKISALEDRPAAEDAGERERTPAR